jgi:hypothetical protein
VAVAGAVGWQLPVAAAVTSGRECGGTQTGNGSLRAERRRRSCCCWEGMAKRVSQCWTGSGRALLLHCAPSLNPSQRVYFFLCANCGCRKVTVLVVIVTMPSFRFHWGHSEGVLVSRTLESLFCSVALGVGWPIHVNWQSRRQKPRYNSMLCPVWSMSQSLRRPVNIDTESVAAGGRVSGWAGGWCG